jgi:hypothetical protein
MNDDDNYDYYLHASLTAKKPITMLAGEKI